MAKQRLSLPLNLPFELCEIIFKNLGPCDLLQCCLVSKTWKKFIERYLCKQILLAIRDDVEISEVFASNRCYRRVKLIKLSEDKVMEILNFFSTIETLEIEDCRIASEDETCIIFNHLTELTLTNCSTNVLKLFSREDACKNLKSFNLYQPHGRPFHNDIVSFLSCNGKSLEEINLNLSESCNIFSKDITSELRMAVRSVFISFTAHCELQTTTLLNIEKFLRSQGDTLQTISLINSANLTLLHRIWNDLKAVKRLYLFSSDPFFDYDTTTMEMLRVNSNIIELELHALGPFTLLLRDLIPFLMAASNLKSLGVWKMRKDLVEFVAYNHFNLRFISCATMENDCAKYYKDLSSKNGTNDKLHLHQYL